MEVSLSVLDQGAVGYGNAPAPGTAPTVNGLGLTSQIQLVVHVQSHVSHDLVILCSFYDLKLQ